VSWSFKKDTTLLCEGSFLLVVPPPPFSLIRERGARGGGDWKKNEEEQTDSWKLRAQISFIALFASCLLLRSLVLIGSMKAVDYRLPWGRPGENLIYAKTSLDSFAQHRRSLERTVPTVDCAVPYAATINKQARSKKTQAIKDDEKRRIAYENELLMRRISRMNKDTPVEFRPPARYKHLAVEVRERQRRKKQLKLEEENRRLAVALRTTRSIYSSTRLKQEEENRQAILKTMSRSDRRRQIMNSTAAMLTTCVAPVAATASTSRSTAGDTGGAFDMEVENGMIFSTKNKVALRTARQIRDAVAAARHTVGSVDEIPLSSSMKQPPMMRSSGGSYAGRGTTSLQAHHTGGLSKQGSSGRPNIIYTPSTADMGAHVLQERPLSLGLPSGTEPLMPVDQFLDTHQPPVWTA
jgi:hypothetical protein